MANLIKKKKSNLLSKSEAPKPSQPYEHHSLINRNKLVEATSSTIKVNQPKKTTTIRCDSETALHLSAIITCQDFSSVNDVLVHFIDLFEGNLTSDERKEISQIKSVLMRKQSNNKNNK